MRKPLSHPLIEFPAAAARCEPHSDLAAELGDAVARGAFSLLFQPQFELCSGRGCGVEALARWTTPNGQSVPPSIFVALAERTGHIHALGEWVLRTACKTARAFHNSDAQRTILSVNVSALQIDARFSAVLADVLQATGFPPRHLELEITESALIGDADLTMECLLQWKQLGVRIAIDDFGSGYSCLGYLARLPVDRLKLDQSLVSRMAFDGRSAIVIRSLVGLGLALGIDVMAEGVETEEQLHMLQDMGCPSAQGYLFGRPAAAISALRVLKKPWGEQTSRAANLAAVGGEVTLVD
jgi:EAL domain-containing protein (putative c-di-GMP-specific phosphodiesterase class I)